MKSTNVWTHFQTKESEADDKFHWEYICVVCIQETNGCTEGEAKALLAESLPAARYARDRNAKYRAVMQLKDDDMIGISRKEKRKIVCAEITDLLKPLNASVGRKLKQLAARERGCEEYDKLLKELRACRNKERETELIDELEGWESKLAEL